MYLSVPVKGDIMVDIPSRRLQVAISNTHFVHLTTGVSCANERQIVCRLRLLLCVPVHLHLWGKLCRSNNKKTV